MKRTATIPLFLLLILTSLCSFAQQFQFTGIRVKQDGDNVTIIYGISGKSGETYDISVSCTSSEQGTIVPHSLSGDLKNVSPGTNKQIIWDVLKDRKQLTGSDFKFTLEAVPTGVQDYTETVNGASFDMVAVEGGTFQMGSNDGDGDEKPVHGVTLSDFCIGKTEVTQDLWQAVMGNNPSYFKGDNLPVERVSWDDIQEFIEKLNRLTGKHYRLPTEAEWEYAARGGKKSRGYKYSGSENIDLVAWYWQNSGDNHLSGSWDWDMIKKNNCKTHPVGQKQPNELGLYDMSGNVCEWCSDWYNSGYYKNSPRNNPQGASSGTYRVYRGGSWDISAGCCRVANRSDWSPDLRSINLGFRLAVSPR